ncbi:MAG: hypothetical protein IKQ69_02745 [Oscillospiraceae bacterium]|nr:hypothetical protein [Oscillospiraceae bacterium]
MDEFSIIVSEEDAIISGGPSPLVDTPFCILLNGDFFPDNAWTDYSFPVLCMWAESVLRNRGKERASYALFFMDGPYRIEIRQCHEDLILEGINSRAKDRVEFTARTTVQNLLHELLSAFKVLSKILIDNADHLDPSTVRTIRDAIHYYENAIRN